MSYAKYRAAHPLIGGLFPVATGGALGAASGAVASPEDRLRGALIGGGVGAAGGALGALGGAKYQDALLAPKRREALTDLGFINHLAPIIDADKSIVTLEDALRAYAAKQRTNAEITGASLGVSASPLLARHFTTAERKKEGSVLREVLLAKTAVAQGGKPAVGGSVGAHLTPLTALKTKQTKEANFSQYVRPALGGAAFGAAAGGMAAPDGYGLQGAVAGAGAGALGAAGGKAVARGVVRARRGLAQRGLDNAEQALYHANYNNVSKEVIDRAKGVAAAKQQALQSMPTNAGKHELGATMLGAVSGVGAATASSPSSNSPQMLPQNDPYGYSRR